VLAIPGVATILAVVFVRMLAHNLLYTYIASCLQQMRLALRPDITLLVFGVAALGGIWITGVFIDRALRRLTLASVILFIVAGALPAAAQQSTVLVLLAVVPWGLAFGGSGDAVADGHGGGRGRERRCGERDADDILQHGDLRGRCGGGCGRRRGGRTGSSRRDDRCHPHGARHGRLRPTRGISRRALIEK
jgi:hypothetical protein